MSEVLIQDALQAEQRFMQDLPLSLPMIRLKKHDW